MAYTPKPTAQIRRQELAALLSTGLAALRNGTAPTAEQAEAIRNAYRTAARATREGVRGANTARQMSVKLTIEAARAAYAAQTVPGAPTAQTAPVAPTFAPFAAPASAAPPADFIL